MESNRTAYDARTDARREFKARLQVALALALDLERKLLQWGERLEDRQKELAA